MKKALLAGVLLLLGVGGARAQTGNGSGGTLDYEAIRASKIYVTRSTELPITIDGRIDEPAWREADVAADFHQNDPHRGEPATERTEFRILYDRDNLYVSVVCFQRGPTIIAELKRDFAPFDGDLIALSIDTFDDDRNGFIFQTNPGGAKRDQQVAGGIRNADWNAVYHVDATVHDDGWTAELAIPFKTLRFDQNRDPQRWGFNVFRIIRYSNESVIWSPAPRPFGPGDIFISGSLEGLEGLRQGRNMYVKPFAVSTFRPDVAGGERKLDTDAGVDFKYAVTPELTLDLTLNTDFSQVEVDEQQVNLTRFSLFFPEKREFFLENAGLFDVGGRSGSPGAAVQRDLIPFFSRRIGLSERGEPLPIRGGARLTGKVGGFDVGALTMQVGAEDDAPSDNWTVLRLKRDVFANSDVGAFLLNRDTTGTDYHNRISGFDANLRFFQRRLELGGFAMRSDTPGDDENNLAGRFEASYREPYYDIRGSYLTIEEGYANDFGFVRRGAIRKSDFSVGASPRPDRAGIRTISPDFETSYVTDQQNQILTREHRANLRINFHAGDNIDFSRTMTFERLREPFPIRRGIFIPVGDYTFSDWSAGFRTSRGRDLAFDASLRWGDFWTGTRRETRVGFDYRHGAHFNGGLTWSRNHVELDTGVFDTDLVALRLNLAFSPRMFLENLIQYNSDFDTVTSNVRFRFIHHPLSDFFIVYTESRPTGGAAGLNRTLSLKVTNLFAF